MKSNFLLRFTVIAAIPFAMAVSAFADQPHMYEALTDLKAARAELQKADPDKGGYRVAAIKAIDEAIARVKAGIQYAK